MDAFNLTYYIELNPTEFIFIEYIEVNPKFIRIELC